MRATETRCDAAPLIHRDFDTERASLGMREANLGNRCTEPTENASLFGQSVARASSRIVVPVQINHEALPQKNSPLAVDLSCLASIK